MNRISILVGLLLLASSCTSLEPRDQTDLGPLDRLVPIAREKAAKMFHQPKSSLWFAGLDCRYYKDWPEQDSTNALRWYTFTFFDPHSVLPDSGDSRSVSAVGYSISLSVDGECQHSSCGRGIGWTE